MSHDDYDDGLVHGHNWAAEASPVAAACHPHVADAASLRTPSSVVHDDVFEASARS